MVKPVYIDPMTDFGFKRIFASESNKELLITFLNELFKGSKQVVDLSYDKNEFVGDTEGMGSVILDLTCRASTGEIFLIEIQTSSQVNFKKRILYYGSKLIADQAPKGNRKSWGYDISEVYVIVLMDGFRLSARESKKDYLHSACICNRQTGEVFNEDIQYIFIELINFTKGEAELTDDLDKWLYVLKNMSSMEKLPVYFRQPIFEKLFQIAEYSKLNKEEKLMYDISQKRKWDKKVVLDFARKEGMEKGLKDGLKKGRHDGIEEGSEKKAYEVVKNLISELNLSDDAIVRIANVNLEFVQKLRNSLKK